MSTDEHTSKCVRELGHNLWVANCRVVAFAAYLFAFSPMKDQNIS